MSDLDDARQIVIDAAIDYCAQRATAGPATGIHVALDNYQNEVRKHERACASTQQSRRGARTMTTETTTPGPWHVETSADHARGDVFEVWQRDANPSRLVALATRSIEDAQLLAAAPTLLAAADLAADVLHTLAEAGRPDDDYWNAGGDGYTAYLMLCAAIEEATR